MHGPETMARLNREATQKALADAKCPGHPPFILEGLHQRIADWYHAGDTGAERPFMTRLHQWRQLAWEVFAQYDLLMYHGVTVTKVAISNPYTSTSEMFTDLRDNRTLRVSTLDCDHPFWGTETNVKFRAVHDYFGHYIEGHPFETMLGEERAYRAHRKMFSPEALPALTCETRGQTSALVYDRAQAGVPLKDRIFPEQKCLLTPGWVCELY